MRKVLAVAAVSADHKELVLRDLKKIFRRIGISLQTLLSQEIIDPSSQVLDSSNVFRAFPYILLTVPDYEKHRLYLEKMYKNNVLFSKFVLLISEGQNYDQLIRNRDEEVLSQQCRNWNSTVSCSFTRPEPLPSLPHTPDKPHHEHHDPFTPLTKQVERVEQVMGGMDIRGKLRTIDAQKKFHLIEQELSSVKNNVNNDDPPVADPNPVSPDIRLIKIFFGLEMMECRGGRRRGGAKAAQYQCKGQFAEYQEAATTTKSWATIEREESEKETREEAGEIRGEKEVCNPYLKKRHYDEVVVAELREG